MLFRSPGLTFFKLKHFKTVLQYLLFFGLTVALLVFALGSIETGEGGSRSEFLMETWRQADKGYLLIMFLVAMLSHVVRALRWQMLLKPVGYAVSFTGSFLSLMIGYLVNLAVPRGGEVTRSINLYKLEKVPVDVSFGTVVVERVVDVICLLLMVVLSFWIEWDKLQSFMAGLHIVQGGGVVPGWLLPVSRPLFCSDRMPSPSSED